ncbi:MAG: hypothetical protein NTX61_15405, partial [Bacteroidetes bacterium]|nr:hypothetical protein [Bacteroidota bacterium]
MKHIYAHFISLLFLLCFASLPQNSYSEGSKEIYIGLHNTWLYMCTNTATQCNNGGNRTPFAVYGCTEVNRLYFATASNHETVFMGFNAVLDGGTTTNHAVFQIRDLSGTIVFPEIAVPTAGTGYIPTINEARVGPNQIYVTGGYTAIDFHPSTPGVFYIEFQAKNNSTGALYPTGINMKLIDITIEDTVALQVKPGRLYAKSWQYYENGNTSSGNYSGTSYVYSIDSIVTSAAFNDMDGGIWIQFCNQWGCANTANFAQDRKSRTTQALLPEYIEFVNPPDSLLFPSATTLGQIVAPNPWGESDCNTGYITFHVAVNKTGNVEIDLSFPIPYTTRILTTNVVSGDNLLIWDGKDGSGTNVPDNTLITFTVKYVNGLTNLPLFDVEGNSNGFIIGLVRPSGTTPLVYWDDSNITGGTTNFGGCLSPPGCHVWNSSWGDQRTINTWWYNVSTSTAPATIVEHRNPQALTFNQSSPQNICAGSSAVYFSVTTDPNAIEYHWSYTGTGATITQTLLSDNHITVNFTIGATSGSIQVYGTNTSCVGNGPTSSLVVNIKPLPTANAPFTKSICSGASTNWTLSSTPAGSTFSWTSPPPTCTANIAACPAGLNNQTIINNVLSVTDLNPGTVTYHVTPTLNSCNGSEQDYTVTVSPLPDIIMNSTTPSICSGQTTNITFSSTLPAATFAWTASGSSGNVSGFATSGAGNITETIINTGYSIETVFFTITATNMGCVNPTPTHYNVTVFPIPNMFIGSSTPSICSGQNTNITLSGLVANTTFNWTATPSSPNLTGFALSGSGNIIQNITNTGYTNETVTYTITPIANGCTGTTDSYIVTVYPVADLSNTPLNQQQCNNTATNINLTSNVAGAQFIWTATPSSVNVSGYSNNMTPTTLLDQLLVNSGSSIETVTYTIIPYANGCGGLSSNYIVTVYPTPDLSNLPQNKQICNNTSTNLTLTSNVSGTLFTWSCIPSSVSVAGYSDNSTPTVNLNQTLVNSGFNIETVTYQLTPHANGCDGPVTDYIVTVYPVPDLTNAPLTEQICTNTHTNITLTSNVANTLFTWTCTPSSGNVGGYSNNVTPTNLLDQLLVNTGFNIETVTYYITPGANNCAGIVYSYTVTVYPRPDLSNNPLNKQICNNTATNIPLTSNISGTLFTWTCTPSTINVTGFSDNAIPGTFLNQTLVNSGFNIETVTYHILPNADGCDGFVADYIVTVYPTPDLSNTPLSITLCNNTSTNTTLTSNVTGTLFTWTCTPSSVNVSGFSNNATPATLLNQTLVNSGYIDETVTYHVMPHANNCDGVNYDFVFTVHPQPDLSNSPLSKQICNNTGTNITLTSNVSGTLFTWSAVPSSGNISGYSNSVTPSTLLDQTLLNIGFTNETVTYSITPHANGCDGNVFIYVVTVYPTPDLSNNPLNKQICNNTATNIPLSSNVTGTLFTWTAVPSSVNVSGYSDNITPTNILNQTLINSGSNVETVTYNITPHANGCDGPLYIYTVTIYPVPDLTNTPLNKQICTNTSTNIPLTSNVTGTLFTWTCTPSSVNVTGYSDIVIPTNLLDQTLVNTGFNIETVTYYLTPIANNCLGIVYNYVMTVYPRPDLSNTPLNKQICNNSPTNITLTSNISGTLFIWTCNPSSGSITGFSDNVIPTTILNQTLTNTGFDIETVTYRIIPQANGCDGFLTSYIVTVYPTPDLSNTPLNKNICNNTSTGIGLTSNVTGTLFTWTCTPSSGNVTGYANNLVPTITLNQTLVNTGFNIETVTYQITPHANGCDGIVYDYIVTVFPQPDVSNSPLSKQICNNTSTDITLTSNIAGTTFTWTCTSSSGNLGGYSDNSIPVTTINQVLTNSGYTIETATYRIRPSANGCNGNIFNYVVTVYPTPDLSNHPPDKAICNNTSTNLTLTSNVTGTLFTWTCTPSSANVSGFSNNATPTVTLNQNLVNTGYLIETVTYHILPNANGCNGMVTDYIVTVYPQADAYFQPNGVTICTGQTITINILSNVAGATFAYTATPSSGMVSGYSNGAGNKIMQTLFSTSTIVENVTYLVTPTANGCVGTPSNVIATINPGPHVTTTPLLQTVCSATLVTINLTSDVTGTAFTWTATPTSGLLSGFVDGSGNQISQTIINSGYEIDSVIYAITPSANGCTGGAVNYVVRVNPVPDLSNTPPSEQICNNQQTNLTLTSDVAGTLFTWTCTPSSGNVSGYSNNATPTTILNQTLVNSGFAIESVTYHITPHANGCDGLVTDYLVTVYPQPDLSNSPPNKQICNNTLTNVGLTSNIAGTTFTWTCIPSSANLSGFSDNAVPTTVLNQTLVNSGYTIETVTYHIRPSANGCNGNIFDYVVTVYPTPDLSNHPLYKNICNNMATGLTLTSNVSGTLFTWTCTPSSGNVSGYSNNPTPTVTLNQTLVNSGYTVENVIYHITPRANGCDGPVTDYTVTVYPQPDLTNTPLSKQICNNTSTNIPLTSNVTGTLFTWTCTPSSGNVSGFSNNAVPTALLNQNLANSGFAIETVTYHLTPEANGCSGNLYDYVVTVYPTPDLSTFPLAKSICNNLATGITLTSNVNGALFTWTCTPSSGNVSGFSNSVAPGTLINQTLVNSGFNIETVTYHITPRANGCDGDVTDFVVTVFPTPDLSNNPPSEQICNNQQTNITLTSDVSGTLFTWTCTPSSGNVTGYSDNAIPTTILNQTLVNSGVAIETVTYHITPHANGCDGPVSDYVVTLVSKADLSNSPPSKQICNNTPTNVTLTSHVPGTLFTWTTTGSSPNVSGYSDNAVPTVTLNQTLVNSGYNIETVIYHVTPHFTGCDGDVTDYTVTVYPTPDLSNTLLSKQICNNTSPNITLTSNVAGTLFTWTCTPSSASVTGYSNNVTPTTILNQTLTNTGYNIETVTYHLTPHANGCAGAVTDYVVTVYPQPDMTNTPISKQICNNNATNVTLTSNVTGTLFTWTCTPSSVNVSGFSNNAVPTTLLNQTLLNSGFLIETVTYHITSHANGCTGNLYDYVVTVYPTPNLSTSPLAKSICNNLATGINLTSNVSGTLFTWTCTPSSGSVSGFSNSVTPGTLINQTLVNSGYNIETLTYRITPHANGCDGNVTDYV